MWIYLLGDYTLKRCKTRKKKKKDNKQQSNSNPLSSPKNEKSAGKFVWLIDRKAFAQETTKKLFKVEDGQ